MIRRQVVFLGPSLTVSEARLVLPDAHYLPPAAMGDVLAAVRVHRPHSIGLVDGSFLGTMSVFHKELLYAIDQGCWVLGAASMGALRAADCAAYGVIGVGEIYAAYASGAVEDDDEVALAHADADHGFQALSDAMVTIRATLRAAQAAGLIDQATEQALAARQKARWFPERSLALVAQDARELGLPQEQESALSTFVREHTVDPKRSDALALLAAMRDLPDSAPVVRPRTAISPYFAATLARDAKVAATDGSTVTPDRLRRWALLHDPQAPDLLRAARERSILARMSALLLGPPSEKDLVQARVRLAGEFGIDAEEWQTYAASVDLDEHAEAELLRTEASIARLMSSFIGHPSQALGTTPFLNALRRSGDYVRLRDAAAEEQARAEDVDLGGMSARDLVFAFAEVTGWVPPEDLGAYIDEAQLGNPQELLLMMSLTVRAAQADGDPRAIPGRSASSEGAARADVSDTKAPEIDVPTATPRPSRGQ